MDKTKTNKTENRSLKTLRNFSQKEIMTIWHDSDIFLRVLDRANLTRNREYLAKILTWAADLIFYRNDEEYFFKSVATYTRRYSFDTDLNPGPTPADFGNYLYDLAEKIWPYVRQLIEEDFGGPV